MRHTATAFALMATLALGLPAMAQADPDQPPVEQAQRDPAVQSQIPVETHLKAAGYDIMQARQMMQAKNDKMAKQHIESARAHIKMAEDEAPANMTNDIRKIATTLEQATTAARTDTAKARQQVAKADQDLQKLIKQNEPKMPAGT